MAIKNLGKHVDKLAKSQRTSSQKGLPIDIDLNCDK